MQIRIQVTKGYIIVLTLLIIGLACLGFGINSFYKSSHTLNTDNLKVQDCISGNFVKGNITSYIVKDINTIGQTVYSGQSQTLISIGNEYIYYI